LIRIAGARAANDRWLVTGNDAGRFRFEIITSGTESLNLQATGGEGRVDLSWHQDDFDLLAGYHLYRSTGPTDNFQRINATIIPLNQKIYRDTDVQPGKPYYYKFTVVKTDLDESAFSNLASGTPLDTIPPVISHAPVTSAPPGLSLTLFADVTDNVGVQGVMLYSRSVGSANYQIRTMTRTSNNRGDDLVPAHLLRRVTTVATGRIVDHHHLHIGDAGDHAAIQQLVSPTLWTLLRPGDAASKTAAPAPTVPFDDLDGLLDELEHL
jgi:hypothetical protein